MDLVGQHISHLGALPQPIYRITLKATSFQWGSEQKKTLQQVQAAVQTGLPIGPYDSADPILLEMTLAHRDAVWQSPAYELQCRP